MVFLSLTLNILGSRPPNPCQRRQQTIWQPLSPCVLPPWPEIPPAHLDNTQYAQAQVSRVLPTCTNVQAHTHTRKHLCARTLTRSHTYAHCTCTQYAHINARRHARTHAHTHRERDRHRHRNRHRHKHSHTFTQHTHSRTHARTHTRTHTVPAAIVYGEYLEHGKALERTSSRKSRRASLMVDPTDE
jgi:hypothetical protein